MRRFPVLERGRPGWHGLAQGAAHTLLPVAGPLLSQHLDNFAAMRVTLPALEAIAPHERVLVLSPHPDDETLGTGGILARLRAQGNAVRLLFLTNGDGSRTTQLVLNAKKPWRRDKNLYQIAENRQLEAWAAAHTLGLEVDAVGFLGFPDGCVPAVLRARKDEPVLSPTTGKTRVEYERAVKRGAAYTRVGLLETLGAEIREFAPTLLLTTHPDDTHPDHVASYQALVAATQLAAKQLPQLPRLLVFPIHYGIWPVPNGFHPELPLAPPARLLTSGETWFSLELSPHERAAKAAALKCYASQLASTPRYLHAFVRRNEVFTFRNFSSTPTC